MDSTAPGSMLFSVNISLSTSVLRWQRWLNPIALVLRFQVHNLCATLMEHYPGQSMELLDFMNYFGIVGCKIYSVLIYDDDSMISNLS